MEGGEQRFERTTFFVCLSFQKVYYEIDWRKFSCTKKALDASFIPMQVPADAKLLNQVFIGSSSGWGMGLLVNNWYGPLPNNGKLKPKRFKDVPKEKGALTVCYVIVQG